MATERLSMRISKEILRQKWLLGRSHRQIAGSVGVGAGSVSEGRRPVDPTYRIDLDAGSVVDGGDADDEREQRDRSGGRLDTRVGQSVHLLRACASVGGAVRPRRPLDLGDAR